MQVTTYQHQTVTTPANTPLMIWIGHKDNVIKQLATIYENIGIVDPTKQFMKFCPNIEKLQRALPVVETPQVAAPQVAGQKAPV
jgi:hypothetical protein